MKLTKEPVIDTHIQYNIAGRVCKRSLIMHRAERQLKPDGRRLKQMLKSD